jgi:eukaryotic-like serine/threonine-protein kinase
MMSKPNRPVGAIFDAALELPPERRAAYLQDACGGDDWLRQRVEALLRAHESAEAFMDRPAVELGRETVLVKPAEQPGDWIGHYKLLQQIGEGGCGVVYMAEQEEPVHRRLALKVIKLGMDTKQVIARFDAERQALALMDHPNIAKVLDAGATDSGRPFFAMELVKGIKITDYCDQNSLPTNDRLDLFIKVCHAIQHAHQKGIIHRDIKPSNILVTLHDGVPVPKVIDFGIAKAAQGRLTDQTLFTAFEQFIGTPAYMSPEQAEMSGLDIDTRSDIYALGVLLYELLTGQTPFDAKDLLAAGLDAMRRTIREQEPARPSTRLSTMQGADLTAIARHRKVEPPRLIHLVRGDLDWIVMKCLEKDRTRRYDTVNGLGIDVRRHLENEPVVARPPSTAYRLQKAWRRHKTAFAAGALMAAVLVAATGISVWQAVWATRAETLAKERLAESEAISKFLIEVFQSADPARDGRTITVAETLNSAAKKLETDLANQPARRAKLQATLGLTYYALGLYRDAIPLQETARDYYRAASGPENPDTVAAVHNLASSYIQAGRLDEALKLREQVLTLRRKLNGPEHPATLQAIQDLAGSYHAVGRQEEALKLQEEGLPLCRKVFGPEHADTIGAMSNLAICYDEAGRLDEALKLREQVLALRRKVLGPEHPDTLMAMNNLANSYGDTGRLGDALRLGEEALALSRKVLGPEHPDTVRAMNNLAFSFDTAGRRDEALSLREQVLVMRRKALGPAHPGTLLAMQNLAISYVEAGRHQAAIALQEEACEGDPKNTYGSLTLATWQSWFGQDADYEATRGRLVQRAQETAEVSTAYRAAKACCLRPSTDAAMLAKSLTLAQRAVELGRSNGDLPWYQLCLGLAEYRNGQYATAERTLTIAEQKAGDDHEIPGIARLYRAMSLHRQNKPEEARKLFKQAESQMPPLPKDESKPLVDGKLVSHDVLICWLAYKESKTLIQAPSATVAAPSAPK